MNTIGPAQYFDTQEQLDEEVQRLWSEFQEANAEKRAMPDGDDVPPDDVVTPSMLQRFFSERGIATLVRIGRTGFDVEPIIQSRAAVSLWSTHE